jgi:hypothetical protein
MQIEKNVAKIEHNSDDYRIVVTVEHLRADAITQEEAEIALTKRWQLLFTQRFTYGTKSLSK